jgi:hypothetical protein
MEATDCRRRKERKKRKRIEEVPEEGELVGKGKAAKERNGKGEGADEAALPHGDTLEHHISVFDHCLCQSVVHLRSQRLQQDGYEQVVLGNNYAY